MLTAGVLLLLSFLLGGLLVFVLVGVVLLFRMHAKKPSLITEGEDLVVPVPVSTCALCKKSAQGTAFEHVLVYLYQAFYFLAACLLFAAFVLERISWHWGVTCCVGAIVIQLWDRYLEHRSPHGLKSLVARVPE